MVHSAIRADKIKQMSPWLLLFLRLHEDLARQVDLGVQGGPDLPLVQSHQSGPKITKQEIRSCVLSKLYFAFKNLTEDLECS